MKHLKKLWVRILVSLFGGGIANEFFFLATGDPMRSRENEGSGVALIAAVVIFGILSIIVSNSASRLDKLK